MPSGDLKQDNMFSTVLNTIPGYVSWLSKDLVYMGINQNIAKAFNVDPEDLIGKSVGELTNDKDSFGIQAKEFFESDAERKSFEVCLEIDGEKHWQLVEAKKYNNGEEALFVGIDITEKKLLEENLAEQQERRIQDAKMATLGEMSASIAHEIRSPLSIILGMAELLVDIEDTTPKAKKYAASIAKNVDRISRIIKSLKNFSRSAGGDPYDPNVLAEIIDDVVELPCKHEPAVAKDENAA